MVCSRTQEFLGQPGRLVLHTAVIIQPLSSEQVDTYLDGLAAKGEDVEGLKHTLHQSEALRALATTPLLLTVLILAYHGKPVQELLALAKVAPTDQPQHLLFHNYVEQSLQREGTRIHATTQQTKHWLAWLARQMTARQLSELYMERLQPDWLPERQRAFYQQSIGLFGGLVVGLFGALFYGLIVGLQELLYGLFGLNPKIEPVEALIWSWEGLVWCLVSGLVVGLCGRWLLKEWEGLVGGLVGWLVGGLAGWLLVGLAGGLVGWLLAGLLVELGIMLLVGLRATVQRYTLRFWLWRTHLFPWQAVPFLDDTVEQLLLRKVGEGYIFRHRLLQDYFASLEIVPPHDLSFRAEARSV